MSDPRSDSDCDPSGDPVFEQGKMLCGSFLHDLDLLVFRWIAEFHRTNPANHVCPLVPAAVGAQEAPVGRAAAAPNGKRKRPISKEAPRKKKPKAAAEMEDCYGMAVPEGSNIRLLSLEEQRKYVVDGTLPSGSSTTVFGAPKGWRARQGTNTEGQAFVAKKGRKDELFDEQLYVVSLLQSKLPGLAASVREAMTSYTLFESWCFTAKVPGSRTRKAFTQGYDVFKSCLALADAMGEGAAPGGVPAEDGAEGAFGEDDLSEA